MAGEITVTETVVSVHPTVSPIIVTVTESPIAVTTTNQGIQGASGVMAATSPITYDSGTQTVGFDNTGFVRTAIANTFTVGAQIIKTGADAVKGLILQRNSATQSANILSVVQSDGTTELTRIRPIGQIGVGTLITNTAVGINTDLVGDNRAIVIKAGQTTPTNNAIELLPLANNTPLMKVDFAGNITAPTFTGNVTGSVSGTSGSTTGNAATATALQTARNINGVSFNGTADITVTDSTKALAPLYYAPATFGTTENRATTDFSPLSATTTFGVSLAASTAYEINVELFFDPIDIAVNVRTLSFGFRLGSGTLTSIGFDVTHNRKSTTLTDTVYHQTINAIGISPIELSRTANVAYESIIRAKGIVTVNTASKLIPTLQWNALGDTLNIRRGSYVQFTPLPNTTSNGTWS